MLHRLLVSASRPPLDVMNPMAFQNLKTDSWHSLAESLQPGQVSAFMHHRAAGHHGSPVMCAYLEMQSVIMVRDQPHMDRFLTEIGDLDVRDEAISTDPSLHKTASRYQSPRSFAGKTFLWIAAEKGQEDVVKFLLEKHASGEVSDQQGMSPLHISALNGHTTVVELILDARANLELKDSA